MTMTGRPIIGAAVPHESARGHVTGDALYVDDLVGRFPNVLHAWPVLAPHAHALVTSIDTAAALEAPGVVTTLTGADVSDVMGENDTGPVRHDEPLFPVEVMYHSQPVAWVLADTLDAAQRGAGLVRVAYEALPAILTIEQAVEAGSYLVGNLTQPLRLASGDLSVLAANPLRFDGELTIGGQEHFYLETQAAIAWVDETGGISVHSSTQHPSETQAIVARVLGLARHQVTVECLRMGGAFGGKEVQANAWAAIAALGAWKTRRPVRVRLTRALDMALTGKRHPFLARYTAGFAADGRLQALRLALYADGGWSLDLSEAIMWRALFHCDNAYRLPAVEAVGWVCRTHKTSQTAFRGFGGPQGMLVIEEIMSLAAAHLRLPPEVVRERNFYRDGDSTHYGQRVEQADRIVEIWTRLKTTSGFDRRRDTIAAFNATHPHQKRGLAMTPVKFGISFTAPFFNQAGALVLIYRDGSVQVNHGGTEMGQGLLTKIHQIAAGSLGVSLDRVRLMATRTDKVPNTSATAASASTDLNGAAVVDACAQLTATLAKVAAGLLGCEASDVRFAANAVWNTASNAASTTASGGGQTLPFAAVCEAAYLQRRPLFAQGFYRTPGIHFDSTTGLGKPFHYFAYGAAASEVEIDGFTGDYRVVRTDILQDVGDSISPIVDRGQIEGGFLQGLGWLTIEELAWDAQGRVATGGASTYKLPSWSELPETFEVDCLERATQPGVVFGSKAVGEPPLMLAISVREAIREAVAAFGHDSRHDSRHASSHDTLDTPSLTAPVTFASPATPERVYFAVAHARAARPALK